MLTYFHLSVRVLAVITSLASLALVLQQRLNCGNNCLVEWQLKKGRKFNLSSREGVTEALTWLVSDESGLSSRVKNCIRDAGEISDLAETLARATAALVNGGEGTYTSCNINKTTAEEMKQGQILLNGDALPMKVQEGIDMVKKHTDEVAQKNRGRLENFFLAQVNLDVPLLPEGVVLQVKTHGQTRNLSDKARFSIVFKQPLSLESSRWHRYGEGLSICFRWHHM